MSMTCDTDPIMGETVDIDGYKIFSGKKPSISWTPFNSNSWRTRLKRVRVSLSGNPLTDINKSSNSVPKRYTYAYPCRHRDTSSEPLCNIESNTLLEIAGSSAQAFKDFELTSKKREGTKNPRKSRKSTTHSERPGSAVKRSTTKKHVVEQEQKSQLEQNVSDSGGKAAVFMKRTKSKEKGSLLPEQISTDGKEVFDGKLNSDISQSQPVVSPVRCYLEASPSQSTSDSSKFRKDNSSSVNIKNWSDEQVFSHFGLKKFTIDISGFPHHELNPSTSCKMAEDEPKQKLGDEQLLNDKNRSKFNKNKENLLDVEHKRKKRKRSISSSSSVSSMSSEEERNNSCSDSGNEPNSQTRNTSKKKAYCERQCVECGRWLDSCTVDWKETLGTSTVWCSRDCIERRVARAHEVLPEGYGALTLLRGDGQLLTTGPTLANLAEFIFKYPEYEPVLPVAKKKHVAKNDQSTDPKKVSSRPLSKDADRVRFNVRRAFSDALLKRAKMDKVKSAMKLCKDVSESVEAALYKFCGSNLNSTWYKSWTKSFIENVADCRNKAFYYRVLTGMISVQKVVSLDGNNMRKPEYSSPLDETCSVNKSAEQGNDARVSSDGDPIVSTRGIVKKESTSVATKASSSTSKCDNKSKRAPRRSDGVQKTVHTATSLSTLDSILGDGAKDTTEQHLSHFYDVNCSICLAKQKSQAEAERKEKEEKERQREEDRRYREMLPPIRPYEFTEHKSATLIDLDYSANSGRDSADEHRRMRTPESTGAACASDDDYAGSYGDDEESPPIFGKELDIDSKHSRNTGVYDTVWNCARTVWSGQISLNSASMRTSLCLVSNPIACRAAPELPPMLRIKGRIVPLIVFDYVHETMRNGEHHVAVLRLTDPVDFECEQRFVSMYEDMMRKGRYFAIDVPRDTCFKDMYLIPLAADEEPPAVLLPFDGPGLPQRHSPMIICIMVIYGPGYSRGLQLKSPQEMQLNERRLISTLSCESSPKCASIHYNFDNDKSKPNHSLASIPQQFSDCDKGFELMDKSSSSIRVESDSGVTKMQNIQPPSRYESGQSTPSDPPPCDVVAVGEADSLLPSKFFLMCKEAAKEPTRVPSLEEIETLSDLLLYIQLSNKPREIKEVVARFMNNTSLSDDDRELIRKKVLEKIASEKKKKTQHRGLPSKDYQVSSVNQTNVLRNNQSDSQEIANKISTDFDSFNQLSSFVGASVQELLKQVKDSGDSSDSRLSPPPPPSTLEIADDKKPTKNDGKTKSIGEGSLASNEMLPGPPPVPPVYGDNDSSGTDSPSDHNSRKASETPALPRPPPFPSLSVVPLPPPPSIVPDIAVPPPPPPPPKSGEPSNSTALIKSMEPSFIAPPPPPPSTFESPTTNHPTIAPSQIGIYHPPIPGMIPEIPFPPPFVGGLPPPPPPSALTPVALPSPFMASSSRPPMPVTDITPSSSLMYPVRTSGFLNQRQFPTPHIDKKEFFPCLSTSRFGASHSSYLHNPQAKSARMDYTKSRSHIVSEQFASNHCVANYSGNKVPTTSTTVPKFGEVPLASHVQHTSESSEGVPSFNTIPNMNSAVGETTLKTRIPTPRNPMLVIAAHSPHYKEPCPVTDHSANKNGPRTPSPDIMRKPDYNAEIERLKKDIEEEKRRADLQTKLDLLELKFQAKLREKAANDSAPKDKEDAIPSQNAAKIDSSSGLEGPSQSCLNDSDAMDVDGGESEEERCDEAENDRIAGTDIQMTTESVPIDKSQGGFANAIKGQSDNVTGQPPQISPHFNFMRGLRGGPPRAGRFGFSNVPGPTVRSRSGFFPPRMRGVVRGAPNLRRGFPKTGGFPPPMTPQPFRGRGGGFYGGRRAGPRGGL